MLSENNAVENELTAITTATDKQVEVAIGEISEQLVIPNEAAAEIKIEVAANKAPDVKTQAKSRKNPKRKRRSNRRQTTEMDQIVAWFAVCGRCSYFLAGYKLVIGEEMWATAVTQRGKHWLTLPWTPPLFNLVQKSYGSQLDFDCFHNEGCCPECQRKFVYRMDDGENASSTFRIEFN